MLGIVFRVLFFGFWISGSGSRVPGSIFPIPCSVFRVPGFGFDAGPGFGSRVSGVARPAVRVNARDLDGRPLSLSPSLSLLLCLAHTNTPSGRKRERPAVLVNARELRRVPEAIA